MKCVCGEEYNSYDEYRFTCSCGIIYCELPSKLWFKQIKKYVIRFGGSNKKEIEVFDSKYKMLSFPGQVEFLLKSDSEIIKKIEMYLLLK
jgi:hypothetical protein